jgi:hypothetical protein
MCRAWRLIWLPEFQRITLTGRPTRWRRARRSGTCRSGQLPGGPPVAWERRKGDVRAHAIGALSNRTVWLGNPRTQCGEKNWNQTWGDASDCALLLFVDADPWEGSNGRCQWLCHFDPFLKFGRAPAVAVAAPAVAVLVERILWGSWIRFRKNVWQNSFSWLCNIDKIKCP